MSDHNLDSNVVQYSLFDQSHSSFNFTTSSCSDIGSKLAEFVN